MRRFVSRSFMVFSSAALLAAAFLLVAQSGMAHAAAFNHPPDAFTAVIVRPLGANHIVVPGTDGRDHLVYELELTNTQPTPATVERIDVIDADAPDRVFASYSGQALLDRLRTLQPAPADSAVIDSYNSRLFYIEVAFKPGQAPRAITQHLYLRAAARPGPRTDPVAVDYAAGKISVNRAPLPVLAPPLRGDRWVVVNGCCNHDIVHRGSFLGVNGALYDAQRFAIDWVRLNAAGEMAHGDPAEVRNYVDYGAKLYAVANGTVVETLDELDDQEPGQLPDPSTVNIGNVDGNHVIIDIGHGLYAFYAHLKKGSVAVHLGEHVTAGTVLGELGNSGNTSAPHLHFQIMDGPSALGAQGLPYVIDHFELAGTIVDQPPSDGSGELAGFRSNLFKQSIAQKNRFPLDGNIISFPSQ